MKHFKMNIKFSIYETVPWKLKNDLHCLLEQTRILLKIVYGKYSQRLSFDNCNEKALSMQQLSHIMQELYSRMIKSRSHEECLYEILSLLIWKKGEHSKFS